jgi:hypothetical protein
LGEDIRQLPFEGRAELSLDVHVMSHVHNIVNIAYFVNICDITAK